MNSRMTSTEQVKPSHATWGLGLLHQLLQWTPWPTHSSATPCSPSLRLCQWGTSQLVLSEALLPGLQIQRTQTFTVLPVPHQSLQTAFFHQLWCHLKTSRTVGSCCFLGFPSGHLLAWGTPGPTGTAQERLHEPHRGSHSSAQRNSTKSSC